jgi:L-fuconolactonase
MTANRTTVTRRGFLEAGAALAAAGPMAHSTAPAAAADEPAPALGKGFVDCHAHVWEADDKVFPLAAGRTVADLKPPSFTPKELMALAEPVGVDRVVLIQHTLFHGLDNRYIVEVIRGNPGRFAGVAVVDDRSPNPGAQMLKLKAAGVRGLRIITRDWHAADGRKRAPGEWLAGEGMAEMWTTAADAGMAICPLIEPDYLASVDAMCRRFPKTACVVDHFARVGVSGEVREADLDTLCALARHKMARVKISAHYALGRKTPPYRDLIPMIRRLLTAFGAERLMWGSDAPYQVAPPHTYKASIDLVKNLDGITPADRDRLLRGTATETFFAA